MLSITLSYFFECTLWKLHLLSQSYDALKLIFWTSFIGAGHTFQTPPFLIIGEMCVLFNFFIIILSYLCIHVKIICQVFVVSNLYCPFVKCYIIVLNGHNHALFSMAFNHAFCSDVFWPLYIMFKYFSNISVAGRTTCTDI